MDNKSFTIRVPKRWVRISMIVGVTALIVAPLTAIATHTFNDVPNTHTFHADIEWLEAAGVTKGCNPPTNNLYCPDDDVTRGQMAAFMKRLAENQVVDAGALQGANAADLLTRAVTRRTSDEASLPLGLVPGYTAVSTVQILAPSSGAIVLQYSLTANRSAADTAYRVGVSTGGNCSNVGGNTHVYGSVSDTATWDTAAGTATFTVGSGTHTYTLCGHANNAAANIDASSLTAMFVAEGSTLPIVASQGGGDSGEGFGD